MTPPPLGVRVTTPARFRLQAPVASEHQQQRQVTDTLRLELCREGHVSPHGVRWFSIDMAHFAGVPGTRIARGICAGVPDMVPDLEGPGLLDRDQDRPRRAVPTISARCARHWCSGLALRCGARC